MSIVSSKADLDLLVNYVFNAHFELNRSAVMVSLASTAYSYNTLTFPTLSFEAYRLILDWRIPHEHQPILFSTTTQTI